MTNIPIPEDVPVPMPVRDHSREAAMAAAAYYDEAKRERDNFIRLLEEAKVACQVKDNQIAELQLVVATERNRYDSLQSAYNEKLQDCADLEAVLAATQGSLEDHAARLGRFEFSRVKRKRNGSAKRNGEPVPDTSGSDAALAELSSLVAHGKPVLGSQSETG